MLQMPMELPAREVVENSTTVVRREELAESSCKVESSGSLQRQDYFASVKTRRWKESPSLYAGAVRIRIARNDNRLNDLMPDYGNIDEGKWCLCLALVNVSRKKRVWTPAQETINIART